ncbi:MAG: diguanylate cyclase [Gammaproteobacteria bacterium]|nr:diguanylate cyclase [Gammaproteobacteria bacterium]
MSSTKHKERLFESFGKVKFTVYADFKCAFCYALSERVSALNLDQWVDFRMIQRPPENYNEPGSLELLNELSSEVAEVRRRLPSTEINIPMFRPGSAAASSLVYAVGRNDLLEAAQLRRQIFRALWVDGQDISDPGLLASLLQEFDIELSCQENLSNKELTAWQSAWTNNTEFNHNLPVIISEFGETISGFLLEPELDAFLESGSLVSNKVANSMWQPQKRQRILVLDNDAKSLRILVEQMHDTQIEVVEDIIGLIAHARNRGMPDLLMVNSSFIKNVSGSDWWRNSTNLDPDIAIPIIHILDKPNSEAEIAAFEAGATDIITKPFHPQLLRLRLNSFLQTRRSQQQINAVTHVDALTSIGNHREFYSRLSTEWSRGARAGNSLALLMIDVDKLRAYNDTYGHLSGDDCLVRVAQLLGNCVRRSEDLVARYKGGMFAALLPEVEVDNALKVAQNCFQAVEDAKIAHSASSVASKLTVSIGVAAMVPMYEKSCTLIIEQVEIALYQAKQQNCNPVYAFDDKA